MKGERTLPNSVGIRMEMQIREEFFLKKKKFKSAVCSIFHYLFCFISF